MRFTRLGSLVLVAIALLIVSKVSASTIGYWRLEEGPLGADATTLASEVNSPALDGTEAGSSSDPNETFSSTRPGSTILDPVAATSVANSFSLASLSTSSFYRFDVDGSLTRPASFTFEMFIKNIDGGSGSAVFAAKRRDGVRHSSWSLNAEGSGDLSLRVDSAVSNSGPGFNQKVVAVGSTIRDDQWHHVAVTYDGTNPVFELFYDYASVGTLVPSSGGTGAIVYDDEPLLIGGRPDGSSWNGFYDEPRLSDMVLSPSEFLRAIPEPSSLALAIVGLTVALVRRSI